MSLLEEIASNEVFPAIGCTEPTSCAYAAATAVEPLAAPLDTLELIVDPGTFKNGASVTVPHTGGLKGNLIAAALGAVIARSALRLEILKEVTPETFRKARELMARSALKYQCKEDERGLRIEVLACGGGSRVHCIVSEGHANVTCLTKDGKSIIGSHPHAGVGAKTYRQALRAMPLAEVLRQAVQLHEEMRAHIRHGIEMNLAIAELGVAVKGTAYQLQQMVNAGLMADDLFFKVKLHVAAAVDARMAGVPAPVMTSGGSGNQGVLTILVPWLVGLDQKIEPARIEESIAICHAVNAYVKCFTGELSAICGCAIAASLSAAIALVYQKAGIDMRKITFAVHNVIGDLCGIICDGAKPGCSMKIVTGAETAMRSAFMALGGYGLSPEDGVLGHSPEESIRNISRVSLQGMLSVDPTVVRIIQEKSARSGLA